MDLTSQTQTSVTRQVRRCMSPDKANCASVYGASELDSLRQKKEESPTRSAHTDSTIRGSGRSSEVYQGMLETTRERAYDGLMWEGCWVSGCSVVSE
jgi:hypothetical protein